MNRPNNGRDLQVAISGHLKNIGFKIQEEEEWDHNNKIDFVIFKFPRYPKVTTIGVQVTSRCNDQGKKAEFLAKNSPENGNITVADKALYLEVDGNVDIGRGGADLVANILYAFQFDEKYAGSKVLGAKVDSKPDSITYRFFDPRDLGSALSTEPAKPPVVLTATPAPLDLKKSAQQLNTAFRTGKIEIEGKWHTFFTEKGYGFITGIDGGEYFAHINSVEDAVLRSNLDALMKLPGKTSVNYQVLFEDAGKTKNDVSYRTAKNIRLLL